MECFSHKVTTIRDNTMGREKERETLNHRGGKRPDSWLRITWILAGAVAILSRETGLGGKTATPPFSYTKTCNVAIGDVTSARGILFAGEEII